MTRLALLALVACGAAPHAMRWNATQPLLRTAHGLLAPDPTVSRVVVLLVAPLGAVDGDIAFACARAMEPLDFADGWATVQVNPLDTDIMFEVPSDELRDALRAAEQQLAALPIRGLPAPTSRGELIDRAWANRQLSEAEARARYRSLQVVIAGHFDPDVAERALAETLGERAFNYPHLAADVRAPHGVLHDRERGRVTLVYAAGDGAATRIAARMLRARLPGVDLRVDPPFTVELAHATSADAVLAAIASLAAQPVAADEVARLAPVVELERLTSLEGLAYRARTIATHENDLPPAVDAAQVHAALLALTDPLVVIGDAP